MEHEIGAREAARELGLTGEAMLAAAAASADTEAALEQKHQFSSLRGVRSKHGGGSHGGGGGGGVRGPVSSATAAALAVVAVGRQPTMHIASSLHFSAGRWAAVPRASLLDCCTVAMITSHR
jgi:hypothetical protein